MHVKSIFNLFFKRERETNSSENLKNLKMMKAQIKYLFFIKKNQNIYLLEASI